ncbi:hypothetical protein EDD18DRAFT_1189932 [Armillaria luteobubalina]|uniref:Uncharacterized protein n=1 Tax=Armillaria luteobubalina TaxID=153913 RepID=A0AA39PTM5_9AGAR|nr:hypothetical protein EDD18DRAFT_1189932 [Armillaria luteobubalina]
MARGLPSTNMIKQQLSFSLSFIKLHLYVVLSLLCFTVVIILAGTTLPTTILTASFFDAYDCIRITVSSSVATVFTIALLLSGKFRPIATVARQAMSEGFLNICLSPVFKLLIPRLLSLIPVLTVAISIDRNGIDTLVVASQVVSSIVLPFIVVPLSG